ncbi:Obg family GTPase CgtA, partial [Candidatus Peregrinibacteria bacterium]|nr:Obg family GTPase CgtA [Candidatus Peregrinibacteria bacterium]
GLIEGAHKGKGLGHEFLRHIMRNRLLVHIIDITLPDIVENWRTINKELKAYGHDLENKSQIVALNKIDLIPFEDAKKIQKEFDKAAAKKGDGGSFLISCATKQGIPELIKKLYTLYKKFIQETKETKAKQKMAAAKASEYKVFQPYQDSEKRFKIIASQPNVFEIKSPLLERMASMTDFKNYEAVARLRHHFRKLGIERALIKQGARESDTIIIAGHHLKFKKSL